MNWRTCSRESLVLLLVEIEEIIGLGCEDAGDAVMSIRQLMNMNERTGETEIEGEESR